MKRLLLNRLLRVIVAILLINFGLNHIVFAQRIDSLEINLESAAAISNQDYLPLWVVASRYGKLEDQSPNGYVLAGIHSPYLDRQKWDFSWGVDYLVNSNLSESHIHQGYAKLKYKIAELSVGWMERTVGVHRPELSTGSLGISRNARPLPVIIFSIPEYTPIPLTKGYLEFKGHWGHGWFEDDRHIANTFLHEKSLYLRGQGKSFPLKVHLGLVHFAQWAGTRPDGRKLDSGLADYWRVITGQRSRTPAGGGDFVNALGNHLGVIDFGFEFPLANNTILFYHQEPYEDKLGITRYYFYDQLSGLSFQRKKPGFLKEVLYEFIYTKHQGGKGIPDPPVGSDPLDLSPNYGYKYGGRDDYYNNFLYQSGWTFNQRSLGTPLFLTTQRAKHIGAVVPNYGEAFISNRIVTHHLALLGNFKKTQYRLLTTYSRHFGTYAGINGGRYEWGSLDPNFINEDYFFNQAKDQVSVLMEATHAILSDQQLQATMGIAFDVGNLYDIGGVFLRLRWQIHPFNK